MARLIDADELMKSIEDNSYLVSQKNNSIEKGMTLTGIKRCIDEQLTVDAEPVRREKWIHTPDCSTASLINQELYMATQSLEMQDKLKEWIENFKHRDDFIVDKTELLSLLNEFVVKEPKIDLGVLNEDKAKVK